MFVRRSFLVCTAVALAGCGGLGKKPYVEMDKKKHEAAGASDKDVSFQSFLGILRAAIAKRDLPQIASMMTPDFGYLLDGQPPDGNVFRYWDQNNVWPELESVMKQPFQLSTDEFMAAPPEFVANPDAYHGYRAGIKRINGAWRFVYFVTR